MITSFEHKGLENSFYEGDKSEIQPKHSQKIADIPDRLDASAEIRDMALRLSKAFNTTPGLWLNLQVKYNLWNAEQKCTGLEKIELLVTPCQS
jgi:plasmid maintenance system antidote protein VapI